MSRSQTPSTPIAVIGMACWYPGADNLLTFWENILARRGQFRPMLDQRLPAAVYQDSDRAVPDKTYSTQAAYIDGFDFDWAGNRIPKSTYETADMTHWLALDVARNALADAGYAADDLARDTTGVILGNTLTGEFTRAGTMRTRWPLVARAMRETGVTHGMQGEGLDGFIRSVESAFKSVFPPVTEDSLAGALSNTIAGRICNVLDLHGGGYTVDGACASSLLAVVDAARHLSAGSMDMVFAGGVDLSLDTFEIIGFAKTGALTPGRMAVYDRNGDGFIPGEGCGFVILKRLADAERDHDRIYAVINGWGVSSDGKGSLTAPSVAGQALALERAYAMAGYDLGEVDFIEGHGTGTAVGDAVEISALAEVMGQEIGTGRVGLTSLKSIVGHTKAAAGIGAFIKAAMAVNRRVLPPTKGVRDPHPFFSSMAGGRLFPIVDGTMRRAGDTLRAGVSAMGFGGINTHVTLASGGPPESRLEPALGETRILASDESVETIPFSAPDRPTLGRHVAAARDRMKNMADGELVDFALDCARHVRSRDRFRAVILAGTTEELSDRLTILADHLVADFQSDSLRVADGVWLAKSGATPRFGFLFPGQGSQKVNMARALGDRFDWARSLAVHADQVLDTVGAGTLWDRFCIANVDHRTADRRAGTESALAQTELAQPAVCLVSLVWLERLRRIGIRPSLVAGHSLGEITALAASGIIESGDAIRLAAIRGRAVADTADVDGTMAWVEGTAVDIQPFVDQADGYVTIANINSPTQVVVSGSSAGVASVMAAAGGVNRRSGRLTVSHAFHSRMMIDAAEVLREAAQAVPCAPAAVPIVSGIDGNPLDMTSLADYLADQICSPVNFVKAVETAAHDVDFFVEVGPGRVLTGLSAAIAPDGPPCFPVDGPAGDAGLKTLVAHAFAAGASIHWDALFAERLTRPFVPAEEKQFLANPVEGPMRVSPPTAAGPTVWAIPATPPVEEDLPEVASAPAPAVVPSPVEHSRVLATEENLEPVLGMLYQAVERITGFAPETLTEELRVLDDLNMDSLKVTELIGSLAVSLDLAGEFDFGMFMNASLVEIASAVANRMANRSLSRTARPADATISEPMVELPLGKPSQTPWVRSFVEDFILLPVGPTETRDVDAWHGSTVAVVGPVSLLADHVADGLECWGVRCIRIHATDRLAEIVADVAVDRILLLPNEDGDDTFLERHKSHTAMLCQVANAVSGTVRGLVLIQRGDGRFGPGPPPIKSWASSLSRERPDVAVVAVDLAAAASDGPEVAAALINSMPTDVGLHVLGIDASLAVHVPVYARVPAHGMPMNDRTPEPGDVIIATGGGQGVTAELGLALAHRYSARMALIGRRAFDPTDATSAIALLLARYRDKGLAARYYACDVLDPMAVARTVALIAEEMGPLAGLVHGAGLNVPRPTATVAPEAALAEMAPKVVGAQHLLDALDGHPLRLLVGLTSVIGVVGMPGNAYYALGNEQLNGLFQDYGRRHPRCHVVNTAYSIWGEIGMGARMGSVNVLATQGIDPIAPEDGIARFLDLIERVPPQPQVIIASRMGTLFENPTAAVVPDTWRFARDIRSLTPGVEAVARVHLSRETDPYLADHIYEGTCLFPTVFGLEAMAQVAARALGVGWFHGVTIQNVDLTAPIMVGAAGADIEIHARVADGPGPATVRAGIRSRMRGYIEDEFSAVFVLDTPPPKPTLIPQSGAVMAMADTDLYGTVLFQGPRFQRITAIRDLETDNATGGQIVFDTEYNKTTGGGMLLGDPYWRDALLQSAQLVIPQNRSLPVRIGTIQCHPKPETITGPLTGRALVRRTDPRVFTVSVQVRDATGAVLETMDDYELAVLSHDPSVRPAEAIVRQLMAAVQPLSQSDAAQGAAIPEALLSPYAELAEDVTFFPAPDGPQGQMAFVHRFMPDFKAFANRGGSIYFANLFSWMGKTRELSAIPILPKIRELLATGRYGLVTNRADVRILGDCIGDHRIVQCRMWMDRLGGTQNSSMDMSFDWTSIGPNGVLERIATGTMGATWVRIEGHGQVAPEAFPDFYQVFAEAMAPVQDRPTVLPAAPEPLSGIDPGDAVFSAPEGPHAEVPLDTMSVSTALAEGNIVGNVYFANYSTWMGQLRDRFFYQCDPAIYSGNAASGELRCLRCGIEHLREAMPFDTVRVAMGLRKLYSCGVDLFFEYFRVDANGHHEKLAIGTHTAVWVQQNPDGLPVAASLPDSMVLALQKRIAEHSNPGDPAPLPEQQVHLVFEPRHVRGDHAVVDGHPIRHEPPVIVSPRQPVTKTDDPEDPA